MRAHVLVFLSLSTVPSQCQSNSRKHANIIDSLSLLVKNVCFLFVRSLINFATGQVIVSGVNDVFYLPSVEIFPLPPSNTCSIPDLPEGRYRSTLSLLSGGRMVVCGGESPSRTLATCIVWTPESSSWKHIHTMRSSYNIFKCSS